MITAGIAVGDRVEMRAGEPGWMGVEIPDLGQGTVMAVEGDGLMAGLYVEVEWDTFHGSTMCRPSIQSIRRVT